MGYNSYTDSFMLMSHKAYEAYKTVKLSDFEKQYPDIYRKLEDMKFIVDDEIDEVARLRFDNRKVISSMISSTSHPERQKSLL